MCTSNIIDEKNLISDNFLNYKILSDIKYIDRLTGVSYEYFCLNFMKRNKPCIFTSELTDEWKSRQKWVTSDGKPNLDYLIRKFGSSVVPVVICDDSEDNNCCRREMSFETYIKQHFQIEEEKVVQSKRLYLKDWHFNRYYPNYNAYILPKYFSEDWLNESCENEKDDFQFVYIGPKDSWTPLHADVFGSYSWSANICGRKRWLLFPPGQEKLLQNNSHRLPFMLDSDEILHHNNIFYFDIIQEAGEIIFVPSGWYHQVWNIENTISINHNWFNSYNISYIWHRLNNSVIDVEQELEDLKGCDDWWKEHQFLLKVHHGMDLYDFFNILEFIYQSRSNSLTTNCEIVPNQHISDVQAIKRTCKEMLKIALPENLTEKIHLLHEKIETYLSLQKK